MDDQANDVGVRLGAAERPQESGAAALGGAGVDQVALELGKAAEHGQHQTAVRRDGVGPCVAERTEAGPRRR